MPLTNLHQTVIKVLFTTAFSAVLMSNAPASLAAEAAVIQKANQLIKAGQYQQAYQLLEPLESENSGNIEYDYLFGVAAVESGSVTRGVFALERVLAQKPNDVNARAEIAKAHFKLGEIGASKSEFSSLLKDNPDAEVNAAVNRFLNAVDKALGLTTTFGAYVDVGLGVDSNINSATNASTVALPALNNLQFNLAGSALKASDQFFTVAGGLSFRHPVSDAVAVFGSVGASQQLNTTEKDFEIGQLNINTGFQYKHFIDSYSLAAQYDDIAVGDNSFRRSYGVIGQWQRTVNDRNQAGLYLQASNIDFAGGSVRDANRYILGGNWAHVFEGDKSPVAFLGIYGGIEDAKNSRSDFLDQDIIGLRIGGQFSATPKLVVYAASGYESRQYDADDPVFLQSRKDDQYDVSIGLRYMPARNWLVRPQLSYIKNDANITLYQYERATLSLNVRRDFNW